MGESIGKAAPYDLEIFGDYRGRRSHSDRPEMTIGKKRGNIFFNGAATKILKDNQTQHVVLAKDKLRGIGVILPSTEKDPRAVEVKATAKGTYQIGQAGDYFRKVWGLRFDQATKVELHWRDEFRVFEFYLNQDAYAG